jgi:RNA polymerase sigma-70 factor, ECF subfamily
METVEMHQESSQFEDAELIGRVAQGDRQAFQALYDRYGSQALGLAMRVLDDRAAGEDVLQEAFMRIWRHADKFDVARGSAKTWILTVVHRLAIDALRRRKARPALQIDAPEYEDWDLPDDTFSVHELVQATLSRAHVHEAMCQLPAAHRTVIELAYFKGMTHREISEHLSEPLGTIHSRVRQSLILLKKMLWGKEVDVTTTKS